MTLRTKASLATSSALRSMHPLGALEEFRTDPLGFLTRGAQRHDGVFEFRLGPYRASLFSHPDAVEQILVTNARTFDEPTRGWKLMRRVLDHGVGNREGDLWRQQRVARPASNGERICEVAPSIVALTEDILSRWDDLAHLDRLVDMAREMNALTLRIVEQTRLPIDHEATASALTWTFYLLAKHPDERRALQAELSSIARDRPLRVEDLATMPRIEWVVRESMRLFPPAWLVERRARETTSVHGVRIPSGALVMVSPFVTHRAPQFWPNPEGFDPERFTPERIATRPPLAYFPFGAERKADAMLEVQLILGTLLRRFSPWVAPQQVVVRPAPSTPLCPAGGLLMGLRRPPR